MVYFTCGGVTVYKPQYLKKMKIKKLLKDISIPHIKGSKDIEITGVCGNSKLVSPGNLFVAKRGRAHDGTQYIPEAIAAGAVAILTDIYDPSLKDVTQLIHPDVQSIEALLAAHYYQFAGDELFMVGITGTNGKTTTSFLIKHMLDKLAGPCGVIGTVEYIIGKHRYQATLTSPDVTTNHKLLREMVIQGCQSAVMEVTSHALEQGRARYIDFDIGVFTNLTVDHLDYHQTMDNYCLAKQKLFKNLNATPAKERKKTFPKTAVVNADSPWTVKLLEGCTAKVLSYGIDQLADLRASEIKMTSDGTDFILSYQGKQVACHSPLVGRFNVYNVLAATGVILARQVPLGDVAPMISTFVPVPGRLEKVSNPLGLKIYVDFAHTDDALINVLECLKELKPNRIITVFGCGGDRDQTKRPKMAQAAEELSDITIVTSDNPRSEDPATIASHIIKGFKNKDSYIVELDRYKAIETAIEMATAKDIILIAGKGHEPYQIFAHKIIEFDDRKTAAQICQNKVK